MSALQDSGSGHHSFVAAAGTLFRHHDSDDPAEHSETVAKRDRTISDVTEHVTADADNGNVNDSDVHFTFSAQAAKEAKLATAAAELTSVAEVLRGNEGETDEARKA